MEMQKITNRKGVVLHFKGAAEGTKREDLKVRLQKQYWWYIYE